MTPDSQVIVGDCIEKMREMVPQPPGGAEDVHLWSEPEIPGSPLECWYWHDYKCCCWGPAPLQIGDCIDGNEITGIRVGRPQDAREWVWIYECRVRFGGKGREGQMELFEED